MSKPLLLKVAFVGLAAAAPISAGAQTGWVPGSEIAGQTVQLQTQGAMNSVYLSPDGTLTITTPGGATVPGTWSAANNQLCFAAQGRQECVPYTQPFQPAQQIALTSSCNQLLTLLAQSTNAPPPPPPPEPAGQRG